MNYNTVHLPPVNVKFTEHVYLMAGSVVRCIY